MSTPKGKGEKEKEKEMREMKGIPRKNSMTEDTIPKEMSIKEMMKKILAELQTMQDKQDKMQEKQDAYQSVAQEQMASLKEELGAMKGNIASIQKELKELKKEKQELKKEQGEIAVKVKTMDLKSYRLEERQEAIEAKNMEYQLRLRNIVEETKENIQEKVTEILTEMLNWTEQEVINHTDRIYRVNTIYAKKNRTARDVIVNFTKKTVRDEVLRINSNKNVFYKGKKVAILREYPKATLNKRRKYNFLTEELKKQNIRFRWEKGDGLMATYKDQRYWILNEECAKDFYDKIKRESEKGKGRRRQGRNSPKRQDDQDGPRGQTKWTTKITTEENIEGDRLKRSEEEIRHDKDEQTEEEEEEYGESEREEEEQEKDTQEEECMEN
ncbi:golgin subfamily A member 6-like protein 6 [Anolis sagrei]|uniref:golgin subfamily A member 6-like protein 6 n=1 Tax=Anolis sagrei TaxID=38937 RepID=UPI003520454E